MLNYPSGSSEIDMRTGDLEGQPSRSEPRRRGRRGGRRRNNRSESAILSGMPQRSAIADAADETAVSEQLRLLMSPKLVKAEWQVDPPQAPDPQLTYRPPATIESFGAKPAGTPVSAATFKKNESPLQAVVATVGSMAILAALYHFGYYEGSQALPEPQQYASAAPLPAAPALPPDPYPVKPTPQLAQETVAVAAASPAMAPVAPPVLEIPPPAPKPTPVPAPPPVDSGAPSGLYLQVAALQDSAAARELRSDLQEAGFKTQMLGPAEDGLIRIISGPFAKKDEARTMARKMAGLGVEPFLKEF